MPESEESTRALTDRRSIGITLLQLSHTRHTTAGKGGALLITLAPSQAGAMFSPCPTVEGIEKRDRGLLQIMPRKEFTIISAFILHSLGCEFI